MPPGWDCLSTLKSPGNIDLLRNLGTDKLKFPFHGSLCAPSEFVDVGEDLCEDELNTSATVAETFQEDTIR